MECPRAARVALRLLSVLVVLPSLAAGCGDDRAGPGDSDMDPQANVRVAIEGDGSGTGEDACRAALDREEPWPDGMPTFASGLGGWRLDTAMGGLATSEGGACVYVGLGDRLAVVALDEEGLAHGLTHVAVPTAGDQPGKAIRHLVRARGHLYAIVGAPESGTASGGGGTPMLHVVPFSLADPSDPRPTGHVLPLRAELSHIAMADPQWLYVGLADELALIDLEDPARPTWAGSVSKDVERPSVLVPSAMPGVVYSTVNAKVTVVDARDPVAPTVRVVYEPTGGVDALARHGEHLYGAGCFIERSFFALDVSDPLSPAAVMSSSSSGAEPPSCYGIRLAVAGDQLLMSGELSNGDHGSLQLLDLSSPREPRETARAAAPGETLLAMQSDADRVLWLDTSTGLSSTRLDVGALTPPRPALVAPTRVSALALVVRGEGGEGGGIVGGGGGPAGGGEEGQEDSSSDEDPAKQGATPGSPTERVDPRPYSDRRWVVAGADGLWTWRDDASAGAPSPARAWRRLAWPAIDVMVPPARTVDGYALDAMMPLSLTGDGYVSPAHPLPRDVLVVGDHAYVAAGEAGTHVVALGSAERPAAHPTLVNTLPPLGAAMGLRRRGDLLYAVNEGGLQVIDILDPARPILRWQDEDTRSGGEHLLLLGPWAVVLGARRSDFAPDGSVHLREAHATVYDLADPERPVRIRRELLLHDPLATANWGGRPVVMLDHDLGGRRRNEFLATVLRTYAITADGGWELLHESIPARPKGDDAPASRRPIGLIGSRPGLLLLFADAGAFLLESPHAADPPRSLAGTRAGAAGSWHRALWLSGEGEVALLGEERTAVLSREGW